MSVCGTVGIYLTGFTNSGICCPLNYCHSLKNLYQNVLTTNEENVIKTILVKKKDVIICIHVLHFFTIVSGSINRLLVNSQIVFKVEVNS